MVNIKTLLFIAFAACAVAAPLESTTEAGTSQLESADQLFARDTTYDCRKSTDKDKKNNKGSLIASISKEKAMLSAIWAGIEGGTASGYPKEFGNKGGLQFAKPCNKKGHTIYEFPILKDQKENYPKDKKKTDTDPGPIRIYYDQYLNFCGIATKPNDDNSGAPHLCG